MGSLTSGQDVTVSANDSSTYTARSGDFAVDLTNFDVGLGLQLGKASAINEIDKDVAAQIIDSTVVASSVSVDALSNSSLSATAKALAVDEGDKDLTVFELNLAGTLSANEVLGDVTASIENSTATSTNSDVSVRATNTSRIDATTEASSKATSALPITGSASVAINAIGWDIADLQNDGLDFELFDALIGSSFLITPITSDAEAYIKD